MKNNKSIKLLAIASLVSCILTGCSGSSSTSYGASTDSMSSVAYDNAGVNMNSASEYGYNSSNKNYYSDESYSNTETTEGYIDNKEEITDAEISLLEEKLVYKCNIEIETQTYNETYNAVKDLISKYSGVIQSEDIRDNDYNWYYSDNYKDSGTLTANISCRVPSKNYEQFVEALSNVEGDNKITSKSQNVENISQEYYDNTTRIEALKIQEQRLLNMMNNAETISEMIEVENRLSEVQYEINKLTTVVKYMDMDVAYSYVDIRIEEVKEYTTYVEETTFFSRLADTFKDVWEFSGRLLEGFITFILYLIPILIIVIAPLGLILFAIIRLIIRKVRKYQDKQSNEMSLQMQRYLEFKASQNVNNNNDTNKVEAENGKEQ